MTSGRNIRQSRRKLHGSSEERGCCSAAGAGILTAQTSVVKLCLLRSRLGTEAQETVRSSLHWSVSAWHRELVSADSSSQLQTLTVRFLVEHGMCRQDPAATHPRAPGPEDFGIWANFAAQTGGSQPVTSSVSLGRNQLLGQARAGAPIV